jgi:hypothetical protein
MVTQEKTTAAMVPYAGYPPTSPTQLTTIPETLRQDNALVLTSQYLPRSPEKKKRSYNRADMEYKTEEDDDDDDNDAAPMEAMELFSDGEEAHDDNTPSSTSNHQVNTSPTSTSNSNSTTQTSSPPDVQYAAQSVPAGQEYT